MLTNQPYSHYTDQPLLVGTSSTVAYYMLLLVKCSVDLHVYKILHG